MPGFGRGDDRPRTAADREAARLERERRRAQREGRPPPEELTPTDEPGPLLDADAAESNPPPFDSDAAAEGGPPPFDSDAGANGTSPVEGDDADRLAPDAERDGAPSWEPFAHEPDPEPIAQLRETLCGVG